MLSQAYLDYMESDHWRSLKLAKAKLAKPACVICLGRNGLDLHHIVYRTPLWSAKLTDTRWLCRECHEAVHGLIRSGILVFKTKDPHARWMQTRAAMMRMFKTKGTPPPLSLESQQRRADKRRRRRMERKAKLRQTTEGLQNY